MPNRSERKSLFNSCFQDISNHNKFLRGSCLQTKAMFVMPDLDLRPGGGEEEKKKEVFFETEKLKKEAMVNFSAIYIYIKKIG